MAEATSATLRLFEVLGDPRLLGRRAPKTEHDLVPLLRAGLPFRAVEAVMRLLAISQRDLYHYLRLSSRTLARRKKEPRLSPNESERILGALQVMARAEEVLGSEEAAREWLRRPNRSLGGVEPISFLDTTAGLHEVLNILGRIEHGIVA